MRKILISILSILLFQASSLYGQNLIRMEYMLDKDSGIGKGTVVNINGPVDSIDLSFVVDLSGLSLGNHLLLVRIQDTSKLWSPWQTHLFYIEDTVNNGLIDQVEYFIDKDSGFGKNNQVNITPSDSFTKIFTKDISQYNLGQHFMHVRQKIATGYWSPWQLHLFYLEDTLEAGPIEQLEYFIDKDSGFGKNTQVSITPSDSISKVFTENISQYNLGQHFMHVRQKVATGYWSPWQLHLFYIEDTLESGPIDQLEYFIDKDSGFGKNTQVSITPADSIDKEFSKDISQYKLGQHFMHVRQKVATGYWSPWQLHLFYIEDTLNAGKIEQLEYFIDKDSGFGKNTQVSITPADSIDEEFSKDISPYKLGQHFMHVRQKVATGYWSPWQLHLFYIEDTLNAGKIEQLEYFIDKDSGFGKNKQVSITPADSLEKSFTHSTKGLSQGVHFAHVRQRIQAGLWSPWQMHSFYINDTTEKSKLTGYRYAIDSSLLDTNYTKGIVFNTPLDSIQDTIIQVTDTALKYADHYVRIWAQQTNHLNSVWHVDTFAVIDCPMLDTAAIKISGSYCPGDSLLFIQNITQFGIWAQDTFNFSWKINDVLKTTNDSFKFYNTKSGTFNLKFSFEKKTEKRCKGILEKQIIVIPLYKDTTYKNICTGDSLLVHGIYRKSSGTYHLDTLSSFGCDSAMTLILKIKTAYKDTIDYGICAGDSILIQGKYRKSAGTFVDTAFTAEGCDSTVTVNLKINPKYSKKDSFEICTGDTLKIHGKKYFANGTYLDSFKTKAGCDSVFSSKIKVLPSYNDSSTFTICSGDSLKIHGVFKKTAGTYVLNGKTKLGCDSSATVLLKVNPSYKDTINLAICSGDSILIQGKYRKSVGTFVDTALTAEGCDSTVTVNLKINPKYSKKDSFEICTGDTLKIHGKKYFANGTYLDSFKTKAGCDSLFSSKIKVLPSYNDTSSFTICSGDSLKIHGVFKKTAGTYVLNEKTKLGCDSIVTVLLNVNPSYKDTINIAICDGDSVLIHNVYQKKTGFYAKTYATNKNCDSTVTVNLKVNPKHAKKDTFTICQNDTIFIHGKKYFSAGLFNDFFQTQNGCDSNFTTFIIVNPTYNNQITIGLCGNDSMFFDGKYRTQTGIYFGNFKTTLGCDSLVTLDLSIDTVIHSNNFISICRGDSILIDGIYRKTIGIYTEKLKATKGCDSIVQHHLSLILPDTVHVFDNSCFGSVYQFNGQNVIGNGTYFSTLKNTKGCDSVVVLHLSERPFDQVFISGKICFGDSVLIGNSYKKGSGVFLESLTNRFGCDSVVEYTQTEMKLDSNRIKVNLCKGKSIITGGTIKNNAGNYTDTLFNQLGCDSLVFTNVSALDTFRTFFNDTMCFASNYNFFGNNITNPGIFTHILIAKNGCDSTVELNLKQRNQFIPKVISPSFAKLTTDTTYKTYQWFLDRNILQNDTTRTITVTQQGVYDVSVTNSFNCAANSWDNTAASIFLDDKFQLKIYPNPANNQITLNSNNQYEVRVYNGIGQLMMRKNINAEIEQIDTYSWGDGVYYFYISSGSSIFTTKIIVLH